MPLSQTGFQSIACRLQHCTKQRRHSALTAVHNNAVRPSQQSKIISQSCTVRVMSYAGSTNGQCHRIVSKFSYERQCEIGQRAIMQARILLSTSGHEQESTLHTRARLQHATEAMLHVVKSWQDCLAVKRQHAANAARANAALRSPAAVASGAAAAHCAPSEAAARRTVRRRRSDVVRQRR